jgi:hypothetical protein
LVRFHKAGKGLTDTVRRAPDIFRVFFTGSDHQHLRIQVVTAGAYIRYAKIITATVLSVLTAISPTGRHVLTISLLIFTSAAVAQPAQSAK